MVDPSPRPLAEDTSLDAEHAWFASLRSKGPAWRFEQTMAWSAEVHRMALAAFDRARPQATAAERREWLLRECHGDAVAEQYLAVRRPKAGDASG